MLRKSALIVVDVQVDFCPGGALPVPDGDAVVPQLNRYMELFASAGLPVYATRDWHPEETVHFRGHGGQWPAHCVRDTDGAAFHRRLNLVEGAVVITKGDDPAQDSYSGFDGHDASGAPLIELLKEAGVETVYVGGLATDYCVRATVLDALRAGLEAVVLSDAIRGVDIEEGDSKKAIEEMKDSGARFAVFDEVRAAHLSTEA